MKKIFGGLNLSWPKIIIMSILIGLYTGTMAMLPITRDTSFRDIAISFEVWIFFGILIIVNSKTPKESALKCFVFFLISQPIIYLMQDVIYHTQLFKTYYLYWFIWTIACLPMGFIGHYMKKNKWYGLLILLPMLILVGFHLCGFLSEVRGFFPHHLLSALFCAVTLIAYPTCIFENKTLKKVGGIISGLIIVAAAGLVILGPRATYSTDIMSNGGSAGAVMDDTYKAYFKDPEYGDLSIVYVDSIEDYMLHADFKKIGETEIIIESPTGEKQVFSINIKRDTYHIEKK